MAVAMGTSKLVHLDLFNTLTNDDVLTQFCKNNAGLRYLSIQRTSISPNAIVPCIPYLKSLIVFVMKENSLNDQLVHAIGSGLPQLNVLDISQSPTTITSETLKYLKQKRKNLKVIL